MMAFANIGGKDKIQNFPNSYFSKKLQWLYAESL
jgi:hypothetical protein